MPHFAIEMARSSIPTYSHTYHFHTTKEKKYSLLQYCNTKERNFTKQSDINTVNQSEDNLINVKFFSKTSDERNFGQSESTLLRMRRNSLDLNSFRADFCNLSIKSSPFKSTTSSLISSVVLTLISFNSSSLFAIITTLEARLREEEEDDVARGRPRGGHLC